MYGPVAFHLHCPWSFFACLYSLIIPFIDIDMNNKWG